MRPSCFAVRTDADTVRHNPVAVISHVATVVAPTNTVVDTVHSKDRLTAASDKHEKQDSRTIHIPVDVPADGEKTVTYTVKYTW